MALAMDQELFPLPADFRPILMLGDPVEETLQQRPDFVQEPILVQLPMPMDARERQR